jgi:uncharacterized protein
MERIDFPGTSIVNRNIRIPKTKLSSFCKRWKVSEMSLFGSVLRMDFNPDSDIDILVAFSPDATWSLFDLVTMEKELEELFRRKIDLVERKAIETSENYIIRKNIFDTMKVIYAAR